jgi:hypothetical protein
MMCNSKDQSDRMLMQEEGLQPKNCGQPQISTPVGTDDDGQMIFAHVRFDAAIKREYVSSLKKYLEFLEILFSVPIGDHPSPSDEEKLGEMTAESGKAG